MPYRSDTYIFLHENTGRCYPITVVTCQIHSFSSLSYDRSKASSKASSPHSAIQSCQITRRNKTKLDSRKEGQADNINTSMLKIARIQAQIKWPKFV